MVSNFLERGQIWSIKNGCRMCKLPGKENRYWMHASVEGRTECYDDENPCDICSCLPGNPPILQVDKDGCKKCPDPETGKISDHRVGDSWNCWISQWG